MDIMNLWMSQRNLRRAKQIPGMVAALNRGERLPRIILAQGEDGEIQVQDGHHRLAAIWLSGRTRLEREEYLLLQQDLHRVKCGRILNILGSLKTR